MLQVSVVGSRVEEDGGGGEIVVEESIRRLRLRRELLDHVFPSASTRSVLKVDDEEETAGPGFVTVLVDTPSSR